LEKFDAHANQAGAIRRFRILALAVLAILSVFSLTPRPCPAAQVTLAWDPSPEPAVTGYRVYYGTSSYYYTAVVDVGTRLTLPSRDCSRG